MNLTEPIFRAANHRPEAPALLYGAVTLSYAQLAGAIHKASALLIERGVGPGDRVAVTMGGRPLHVIIVLALARIGAVSLGLNQRMPPDQQRRLIPMLGLKHLVHMPDVPAEFVAGTGLAAIEVDLRWLNRPTQTPVPVAMDGAGVWRLALSSGTTGTPKAMAWTHERTLLMSSLMSSVVPAGPATRFAAFFDLTAFAGMHQVIRHLIRGASVVLPESADPAGYIHLINSGQITDVFTTPAIALRMLETARAAPAAAAPPRPLCPGLRYLALAGSSITADQHEALQQWIAPNVQNHYGLTEGGLLALGMPGMLRRDAALAGQLQPWVEARAVDPEGRALPPGQEGRLIFRSPLFCNSYEGDAAASAATFIDGWYLSGDSGSVDQAGLLRLLGREDGMLNLGGYKVKPETVEAVLLACQGVDDAAVFAAPVADSGRIVLLAAVTGREPVDQAALIARCRDVLGPAMAPVHVIQIDKLPRNAGGKLMRQELARGVTVNQRPLAAGPDA